MANQFVVLTNTDGDPVAFNLANVIAIQPHGGIEGGSMVWTVPGISDVSWCNWLVQETYEEIGKKLNWIRS